MEDIAEKVADRMRRLCSHREYCRTDILKKAAAALDGDLVSARQVVNKLAMEKYVDDLRYASAFARDKSALAGWGAAKIRYALLAKGIDREDVARALEEIDSLRAGSRFEKLMLNKYRMLKDDPQCRMKLLRFALGRGYGYDETVSVLDMLKHNDH